MIGVGVQILSIAMSLLAGIHDSYDHLHVDASFAMTAKLTGCLSMQSTAADRLVPLM